MKLSKSTRNLMLGLSLFSLAVLAVSSSITFALFVADTAENGSYPGTVGLRSYFQKGDGTESNPFVISRPVHFYNLTRLQNLGVFGSKNYFTLGYDPNYPNDPYGTGGATLKFYQDNTSTECTSDVLDLTSMSGAGSGYNFVAIGNEGSPFYGEFNGNGLTVKGLRVHSGPEDVGVFGYINSRSVVQNVCFQDLSVIDDGYDTSDASDTRLTSLYNFTPANIEEKGIKLRLNSTPTIDFTNLPQDLLSYTKEVASTLPSFTFTPPALGVANAVYDLRSSSEYLTVTKNLDGTFAVSINRGVDTVGSYNSIENNASFIENDGTALSIRLSCSARILRNGIYYSKVLATYKLTFTNTLVDNSGTSNHLISVKGAIDYVSSDTTDENYANYTQYAHGCNIGFLIGHCDGTAKRCYVYNGSIKMNTTTTGVHNVAQETEMGLIGEVGASIKNEYDPTDSYATAGDTGVVNFSKMYSDIAGTTPGFVSHLNGETTYYTYTPLGTFANGTCSNIFAPYLRRDFTAANNGWGMGVTNASDSIDFAGQKIIKDETGIDRNLGVFSLVTSTQNTDGADYYLQGLGEFNISHRSSNTFDSFYYTTAEFADTTCSTQVANGNTWGYNRSAARIHLGTHMPTYSDSSTWSPLLERYTNYIIKCPLQANTVKNYFYNSKGFIKDYFSYKLIGKGGVSVTPGSRDFGVFVKNVNLAADTVSDITSFDSALKLSASSTSTFSTLNNDGVDPVKSIQLSIKSATGANVTVMAASTAGSGGYVSIYDKTHGLASGEAYKPAYSMYLPYTTGIDDFCYFDYTYSPADGVDPISSKATWARCGERLFAHTFKLPMGDYFIQAPTGNAYIYYVCAQGQSGKGNTGNMRLAYSSVNTLENVDFVDLVPDANYFKDSPTTAGCCFLTFSGTFSASAGTLSVNALAGASTPETTVSLSTPNNLLTLLMLNDQSYPVTFNGTRYTSKYIVYPTT